MNPRDLLDKAIALQATWHHPDVREQYRQRLEEAIHRAEIALESTRDPRDVAQLQHTLVHAHAARAEDARYGAGQLSRGSQRAPTREDCDDGWLRVESIVQNAESSARQARRLADLLDTSRARTWALRAERSAHQARHIVVHRNPAYTFHTDPSFSFGEGWHVAAAGVLGGIAIQLEPDRPQTAQAERFLRDAGLGDSLVPYASRPRSNKQLTAIVARAFRADPGAAQRALRAAFLGNTPIPSAVLQWTRERMGVGREASKVLLWVRQISGHDPERNTAYDELVALARCIVDVGCIPVLYGDAVVGGPPPEEAIDLTLAWKAPLFQGEDMRRAQLQLFEALREEHGLVGQIGVTSAGMDGPALLGLPTIYITERPNVRMQRWVGAVPGYVEVLRAPGYLERIQGVLDGRGC